MLIVMMLVAGLMCAWAQREWLVPREREDQPAVALPGHRPRQPTREEFLQALRGNLRGPIRRSNADVIGCMDEVQINIVDKTSDK
jgi:hypothetical protein